ncbi:hypothetical protein CAEBREN_05743 [Caenorhabditis brenneri]|uniref:Uncharacterized protein n=1 Tax=Caenorhabditis brenneri TaxID=135651 RepID=G0P3U8_CAEBE|nr:hypothetical protein CAEBREN_05743 [Caenorhabditis brenneri]
MLGLSKVEGSANQAPVSSNGTAPQPSTNGGPALSSAWNRGTGGLGSGFSMPFASQQTSQTQCTVSKMKDFVFFNRMHGIYRCLKPAEIKKDVEKNWKQKLIDG